MGASMGRASAAPNPRVSNLERFGLVAQLGRQHDHAVVRQFQRVDVLALSTGHVQRAWVIDSDLKERGVSPSTARAGVRAKGRKQASKGL